MLVSSRPQSAEILAQDRKVKI